MSRKDTWEWKIANKKKSGWNVDNVSTPFFFTNFLVDMDNKQLWSICEKYGRVSDVYIARKLSKAGKRFAFGRFLRVQDEKRLELKLQDLWIGSSHVFVSLAKFGREDNRLYGESQVHGPAVGGGSNTTQRATYANIVKGDAVKQNKAEKSITLESKDIINNLAVKPSVFCQIRSVRLIPKLLVLLKEEGFHDLQIKYLGGDWVYVEFDSDLLCSKFKKASSVHAYFSNFRPVVNGFKVVERVIWIEILGLPCCAWNDNAVNKVAGIWGEVCFLDDDNQAPLATKRACIKTAQPSLIQDKLSLVVQGIKYDVVVRELSNWEPDMLCNEDDLSCDIPSLANDSDKDVNDFDDGVAEEEGEMTHKERSSNSVSLDAPMGGPIDVNDDQRGPVSCLMNCMPLNIYSTHSSRKRNWVKSLCVQNGVTFLGLQETRMTQLDLFKVRSMWGNCNFDFAFSSARGRSGGILSIWDPNIFKKFSIVCTNNVVIVRGIWVPFNMECCMVNVYAPQDIIEKRLLWNYISSFITRYGGNYVIFGDFNVVRSVEERFGSVFCSSSAEDFNNFIDDVGGVDVPMIRKRFTRVDSSNVKLSKLDRFLVSEDIYDRFQGLQVAVLDRLWSDHCLILLHEVKVAYGPPPFRFFNSWMELDRFDEMIRSSVSEFVVNQSWSKFVVFKNKLKFIKNRIREWRAQTKEIRVQQKNDLKTRLHDIDISIDSGDISTQLCNERKHVLGSLASIESQEVSDLVQKTKVKWSIEAYNTRSLGGMGVWKRIVDCIKKMESQDVLTPESISIVVGDGSVARFWEDVWCGGVLFKTQFPRLYSLSLMKDGLVAYFWTSSGWNFFWRRHIRGGIEAEQFQSLMQILTPIQLSSTPDRWSWSLDPSGVFSVNSMRRHIDSLSLPIFRISLALFLQRIHLILLLRIHIDHKKERMDKSWNQGF
ncbi:unnamed protein product [Lactuca virosa]|uniref:RRM domain-containing protein n=1 Tax=Lactuca virosa TaxID=75947 RepID=A0AAU9MIU1_9ASTR|nr:unnamed protein product [Lactuca virosa]